jgi:transglutaminase-like putative cysteine protease
MKQFIFSLMLVIIISSGAAAEPMSEADIPVRYKNWHIAYEVNHDGSYVETQRWSATILKESALEEEKKTSVTFSTSVATGEIIEAYTLKKSGQRIDAPKSSYQVTTNDGYKNASPLYSDETTITVIFPDLAVGDTTVFSAKVTNKEGMFPGQFSVMHYFSRYTAYDDVVVEITAPVTMEIKRQSYYLVESPPLVKEGKQKLRWTFKNTTPEKWSPEDSGIAVIGDDPSLFVSSFKNYQEIAEAYGSKAIPKAKVTDRLKKLAGEIVDDKSSPEAQAHAIYDGNCIGIGAVVPRDLDVVLDNKMGDCKDHATLMQGLLAARDIESGQALINAGGIYQLPPVPVVSAVNHVINYIPKLNLFIDATSSITPFGMLPFNLGEKPVLLTANYRDGQKTPSTAQYGHEQSLRSIIRINADGSAKGEMEMSLKGLPAIGARALFRLVPGDQEAFLAKKMLESQGYHGTATLRKDDPTALLDTYKLSLSFVLDDFVTVGTAVGIPIKPVASTFSPIDGFIKNAFLPNFKKPQACSGGKSVEEYVLEFPPMVKLIGIPKNVELLTNAIDYRATYLRTENTLTVRRELRDKTPTNVCSPEYSAGYNKSMLSIAKDLKSQILVSD